MGVYRCPRCGNRWVEYDVWEGPHTGICTVCGWHPGHQKEITEKKVEEHLKGHLEEFIRALERLLRKEPWEWEDGMPELEDIFEKIILAWHRYMEDEIQMADEILAEIRW